MKSYAVKSQTRPARDCFSMATASYELARNAKSSWEIEYHCITGVTFTAFSIEAMINHYGIIYFPDFCKLRLCRKDLHKKLFSAVNLPNYLGSKNYQKAYKCIQLRDNFAHGKTTNENLQIELKKETSHNDIVNCMTSIKSKAFREVSIEILESFIDVTKTIEKEIEINGFYPNQDHIPEEERESLTESPLSCGGVSIW